ncbi:hypothetical protein REPUB_Repub02eG0018200 [Reevesia pubescens]
MAAAAPPSSSMFTNNTRSFPQHFLTVNNYYLLKLPPIVSLSPLQLPPVETLVTVHAKSRNQKKREAKRAIRWGIDLASFSTPQIKRILRVASLERDVLDALMLVKRLGPDVREGKRRQFNYIGKLLREVEPELMDALIQATKVGDQKTLQALAGSKTQILEEEDDQFEYCRSTELVNIANRWFDGLISKEIEITNEVYSINSVDFDRQYTTYDENVLEIAKALRPRGKKTDLGLQL